MFPSTSSLHEEMFRTPNCLCFIRQSVSIIIKIIKGILTTKHCMTVSVKGVNVKSKKYFDCSHGFYKSHHRVL